MAFQGLLLKQHDTTSSQYMHRTVRS